MASIDVFEEITLKNQGTVLKYLKLGEDPNILNRRGMNML